MGLLDKSVLRTYARSPVTAGLVVILVLLASSCAGPPKRHAVPVAQMDEAELPGLEGMRDWADEFSEELQADIIKSVRDERPGDYPRTEEGFPLYSVLAISGGGANGAFGAGFLKGWSASGERPMFKLITGISTGALIAPFAFLGPDYDDELETAYTTLSTEDIFKVSKLKARKRAAFADTRPLAEKIEAWVGEEELTAIAREHARGRRLYIGTTNLDAQRMVVWNMGAIAASGHPGAPDFFRKIMLASASVPVAFPPVFFEVQVGDTLYDELHVDGGITAGFFLYGATLDLIAAAREAELEENFGRGTNIYIVRNGKFGPPINNPPPRTLKDIAMKSLEVAMRSQSTGDLYRTWAMTENSGAHFHFVSIPEDYVSVAEEAFDPVDMRRLFDLGYETALSGKPWKTEPRGIHPKSEEAPVLQRKLD